MVQPFFCLHQTRSIISMSVSGTALHGRFAVASTAWVCHRSIFSMSSPWLWLVALAVSMKLPKPSPLSPCMAAFTRSIRSKYWSAVSMRLSFAPAV